jgi:predicted alpha/beta superfamily hydrolase
MKRIVIALVSFALQMATSCTEEKVDPSLVTTFSITSGVNGATYEIKVAQPADYFSSTGKYAVIYVLDGEENLGMVTNTCKKISESKGVPNVLVVSIGYGNDRSLDYTPTKTGEGTGGGLQFLQFIKRELVPKIEQDFRADTTRSQRVLLGHSYGGLFGACAFGADNNMFGNYILLSPSLWYDNEVTFSIESLHRSTNKDKEQLIFMGLGEAENSGRMQAPFDAFYQVLKSNYSNLRIATNRERDLDHVGSKNPNIQKGLEFYFQNRVGQ